MRPRREPAARDSGPGGWLGLRALRRPIAQDSRRGPVWDAAQAAGSARPRPVRDSGPNVECCRGCATSVPGRRGR